jgi:hypothetical protein
VADVLDTRPTRFRHWSLAALGGWTLLVWLTRLRNLLSGDESAWWWLPAVGFLAGGGLCLWAWWRGGDALATPVRLFAVVGSAYWIVRSVGVVAAGHSAGFVVVHLALAAVTVALSLAVLARLRRFDLVPATAIR